MHCQTQRGQEFDYSGFPRPELAFPVSKERDVE
jgi:hypothetical protein